MNGTSDSNPDIASPAALIGHPSRAAMLTLLLDGRALPAGELARAAGISPQTASSHLDKLLAGNLLAVESQGRHRYYRLGNHHVADLLESLAVISSAQQPERRTDALAMGRTCYGHLAGRLGVSLTTALTTNELISGDFLPTDSGSKWFEELGVNVSGLRRQPLARACLDWSERRHHLAGALGVALATRLFELDWVARTRERRVVRLTSTGDRELRRLLGLAFDFQERRAAG